MQEIIGHHVCENRDDSEKMITRGFPKALSIYKKEELRKGNYRPPYLGTGYYFWDYNIQYSHYWGKNKIRGSYCIYEATILYNSNMLDLVGNRQDMEIFRDYYQKFEEAKEINPKLRFDTYSIASCIEYMRELNLFTYKAIRAIDHTRTLKEYDYFFNGMTNNKTNLNPLIIVCLVEEDGKDLLTSFELKYEQENEEDYYE